jgi:SAM-dependent methyltransferase
MENNTFRSFSDKWTKNPRLGFEEILNEKSDTFKWILTRNGFSSANEFREFLRTKKRILDAGCGNGRVTALLRKFAGDETEVVGIDMVASHVALENLRGQKVTIATGDLLGDLSHFGQFDFIYCQEVLHHTGAPRNAFINLCGSLSEGGEIAIYVYRKKAPIREFVDDFVRERLSELPYEKALETCEQIAALGKVLSELHIDVDVPSVDVLEIAAGKYDLQRFIYHFFMKCYWNPGYSFNDNVVINYDWYHPQESSRHTMDEIREWFSVGNIGIIHILEDPYGITARGIKN